MKLLSTYSPSFKAFLKKVLIFCVLFIGVTGILGPWIIGTKLLYGFHFFIYANMGKMILFSAIAFIILIRRSITDIRKPEFDRENWIYLGLSFILIPVFFFFARMLLEEQRFSSNLPLSLGTHLIAVLIPSLLLVGVFGRTFISYFVRKFRTEIWICLALSVIFYFAIFQVWKLWKYLSFIVLKSVAFLLSLHVSPVKEIGTLTLVAGRFAVRIEQACSGLDSMFLFSCLYLLIGLVDWDTFNKKKLILSYFPALLGMFIVNIFRVYGLILVGVYISPQLALKLFHTYLGMVLFITYFALFWMKAYAWMKR